MGGAGKAGNTGSAGAHEQDETRACDLLVIGGGVNGAGIARDAAGRGLSVLLCEKDDLASHTSSSSSKLVHGGLRYLEQYEFSLVRKALAERERVLQSAPHIARPLRFVMPHDAGQRPAWLIRAGLLLYDALASRAFVPGLGAGISPPSRAIDLRRHRAGAALKADFVRGFEYADGWVDDARLVALAALDAHERGATILTRTACVGVQRHPMHWSAQLVSNDGRRLQVNARCLVDATGPWAGRLAAGALPHAHAHAPRLVKGSHIVVPRLFDHPDGYIFQHPDGRIVFALPYEEAFTLIGTTDVEFAGALDEVAISAQETDYLCALSNHYFKAQITPRDVVWSFAGVRPLAAAGADSASAASRDFQLDWDAGGGTGAPILTVLGGKITTFRILAQQAVDMLARSLGNDHGAWTQAACLPGGDLFGPVPGKRAVLDYDSWAAGVLARYAFLSPALVRRYARAYGTRIHVLLDGCRVLADLGPQIVPGLYAAEADYLVRHEWAASGEDILWRRTKLGLHAPPGSAALVDAWLAARAPRAPAQRLQPA